MGDDLLEKLKETTGRVRSEEPTRLEEARTEEKRASVAASKSRSRTATKYADEHTKATVADVESRLEREARRGKGSHVHEWQLLFPGYNAVDDQELANIRALRRRVAKHFSALQFYVTTFERPLEEVDSAIPISDGYSPEHPPMKTVGQTLGLEIRWEEDESVAVGSPET